jgi:hypothetical protein
MVVAIGSLGPIVSAWVYLPQDKYVFVYIIICSIRSTALDRDTSQVSRLNSVARWLLL